MSVLGFGAAGRAGKASLDGGGRVGKGWDGVVEVEDGDVSVSQGRWSERMFARGILGGWELVWGGAAGSGRAGKGLVRGFAAPQDAWRDTAEREDCAVEDLRRRTRLPPLLPKDDVEEVGWPGRAG
jgi:hypothetical protein